jgi:hypothetical protein
MNAPMVYPLITPRSQNTNSTTAKVYSTGPLHLSRSEHVGVSPSRCELPLRNTEAIVEDPRGTQPA